MHSFRSPTLFFLVAMIFLSAPSAWTQEKKKTPKKPAAAEGKPEKTPAEKKSAVASLGDLPLPAGAPQKGVSIPIYSPDGTKTMYYRIGVVTRLPDGENIAMTEMELQTYDKTGKEESIVKLPDAILHIPTNVITAKAKVLIRDERYEITANSLSYDMNAKAANGEKDSVASLGGGVKMTIFDTDSLTDSGKKNDGPEIKIEPLNNEPAKK